MIRIRKATLGAMIRFHKIMRHTYGRSRDIYGARGRGTTYSNLLIFIIETV
jgi:hypothetical protein